jgi:hypothetical protein
VIGCLVTIAIALVISIPDGRRSRPSSRGITSSPSTPRLASRSS